MLDVEVFDRRRKSLQKLQGRLFFTLNEEKNKRSKALTSQGQREDVPHVDGCLKMCVLEGFVY